MAKDATPSFFISCKMLKRAIKKATAFLKKAFCTKQMSPASLAKAAIRAKEKAEVMIKKIPFVVSEKFFMRSVYVESLGKSI